MKIRLILTGLLTCWLMSARFQQNQPVFHPETGPSFPPKWVQEVKDIQPFQTKWVELGSGSAHQGFGFVRRRVEEPRSWGMLAAIPFSNAIEPDFLHRANRVVSQPFVLPQWVGEGLIGLMVSEDASQAYFETRHLRLPPMGFGGPVPLGIALDGEGRIKAVQILANYETESYLSLVKESNLLAEFSGQPAVGEKIAIDAVSGATITSVAIAETVGRGLADLHPLLVSMGWTPKSAASQFEARLSKAWIFQLVLIACMFVPAWLRIRLQPRWRWWFLQSLPVVLLGFWWNRCFTFETLLTPLKVLSPLALGYLVLVLLGAIWDRNTYCRVICPYGNLQRMLKPLHIGKVWKIPLTQKWICRTRWLLAMMWVGLLMVQEGFHGFEPFPYLFRPSGSLLTMLALGWLAIGLKVPLFWCRVLCPTGAILDSLTTLAHFRLPMRKSFLV